MQARGSRNRRHRAAAARLAVALAALPFGLAPGAAPALSTVRVASGLEAPVFATAPPSPMGGMPDERLFIVEQGGVIRILDLGTGELRAQPFLDISSQVLSGAERGLLGLAFAPDYATSGAFYVYYTASPDGVSTLSRFRVADPADDQATGEEKVLLEVPQPFANHNGGTIAFGPDGMLYLGLGDGGGANDPQENAQMGTTLLGKLLRIDVSFYGFDDDYAVPPDNPFVGDEDPQGMTPNLVLDEIWALGLRNPFRFSFDRQTGDLYIGDVGQDAFEEIDVEPAPDPGAPVPGNPGGNNYGWDLREGFSAASPPDPGEPNMFAPDLIDPIHAYAHGGGQCSAAVTGGAVYRGDAIPSIQGQYFFADFCMSRVWELVWDGAGGVAGDVDERTSALAPDVGSIDFVSAFGEDASGELYIVDVDGEVFQMVPEPAPGVLRLAALSTLAGVARLRRGRRRRSRRGACGALAVLLAVAACASPAPEPPPEPAAPVAPASGQPHDALVWEVRGGEGEGTLYLLGSIHFGNDEVGRFRPAVLEAWERADALVVEVHPDDLSPEDAGSRMLERALLPPAESLRDRIPEEDYERLRSTLAELGLPAESMDRFEPWFAGVMLAALAMTSRGYDPEQGVDRLFMDATSAAHAGKEIVALESFDFQVDLLDSLPDEVQVLILRDALESTDRLEEHTESLVEAWKRGDPEELEAVLFAGLEENPELAPFYEVFFFERNVSMSDSLAELLDQDRVWFAVVGAGHLVGDRGIAALLDEQGYDVRRLP